MRNALYVWAIAVSILLTSCGGGSGGDQVLFKREKFEFNEDQPVLEYSIEHAKPAPEITVAMDGVPDLSDLPAVERSSSNAPEDFIRFGSQLITPEMKSFSSVDGDFLVMTPDWVRTANPPTSDLAWAVYGFGLTGYVSPGTLQLWWDGTTPPAGNYFIGISNFDAGRWQWFQGPAPGTAMDFGNLADFFSPTDTLYIAVVLTGQGSYSLGQLRLGDNIAPVADLQADTTSGTVPLTVNFDASASYDIDGDITSFEWDFTGDGFGAPGTDQTAQHVYNQTGNFLVRVQLTDNEGAQRIAETVVSVTPVIDNDPPTAVLGANKTTGSAPLTVLFNGTGSSDPDGTIVKYEWDLDGNGSFEKDTGAVDSTSTTFNDPGNYDIKLRVTDDLGSTATDNLLIEVMEVGAQSPPDALMLVDYGFRTDDGVFNFDASVSTDPDDDIVKYEFDWDGDGTYELDNGGTATAQHTYPGIGTYTPVLRVTDSGGLNDTFQATLIVDSAGNYHETEANDDSASADQLPGYGGYAKGIQGWRGNLGVGGYDGSEEDWLVFAAPEPLEVQLNLAFIDAEADIDIRLFHESDLSTSVASSTGTGNTESISYSIPADKTGTYFIRIYIYASATDRGPADYTFDASVNRLPVVTFNVSPLSGNVPFPVTLDATGSYDPDGTITKYEWDVDGNGSFEQDTGTTSVFMGDMTVSGTVAVKVRVTDDQGGKVTKTVNVNSINGNPNVVLTASPLSGEAPLVVDFDASGSTDPDGHDLTKFEWDYNGDGTWDETTTDPFVTHTYYSAGTVSAMVRVTDQYGASGTDSVDISVSLTYDEVEDNDDYLTGNMFPGTDFTGWFGNLGPDGPLDGDESDWMKIQIVTPGSYVINMYFTDALSDLDLKLYDTDGTSQIGSSTSTTDNESITYNFTAPGTYYINAYVWASSNPKLEQDYMMEVLPEA
ncbi:MAG: PKD domain-containing protein [Planctomycetales bacterium]|nr:PKD domain-containing protein [bacterium]UNM09583.1 MAG: PKD domain-containing protein [Planctomycetales bacterium]